MTGRRSRGGLAAVAAAVVLTLLAGGCGFSLQAMPKIGGQSGPTYALYARFENVLNLPANAQVRDGSAVVGEVSSISTHDFLADLTLSIRKGIAIPTGTTAEVRFDSPLGDEYIQLIPPTKPGPAVLTADSTIPVSSTSTAPSIEDTLTVLGTVLNGGGVDELGTIVSQLNDAFTGNQRQIRSLFTQLTTTLKTLSNDTPDITKAIAAVGKLAKQLDNGAGVITRGIVILAPATKILASENGDLHNLLVQLTNLSKTANRIVALSGSASINDAHQLLPVVNQLVSVESQLDPDLSNIATFEADTPKIAPGDYLQVSVTLNAQFNSGDSDATTDAALSGAPQHGAAALTAMLENGLP